MKNIHLPIMEIVNPDGGKIEVPAFAVPSETIDDSTITDQSAWSSKKTSDEIQKAKKEAIDSCAPLFHQKASVVQGALVKDYPLSVKTHIEPIQEGVGDPSPDNVRPIRGWNELTLEHCGKNLLQIPDIVASSVQFKSYDCFIPKDITVSMKKSPDLSIQKPIWRMSFTRKDGSIQYAIDERMPAKIAATPDNPIVSIGVRDTYMESGKYYAIQIELGSEATSYEPYHGESIAEQLPEEVFGGVYDWESGELRTDWVKAGPFTGEKWEAYPYDGATYYLTGTTLGKAKRNTIVGCCNVGKYGNVVGGLYVNYSGGLVCKDKTVYGTLDDLKNQLNKTPIVVAYRTGTERTIKLHPHLPPSAFSGTNILYASAGDSEVTGRADSSTIIAQMQSDIAALQNAVVKS